MIFQLGSGGSGGLEVLDSGFIAVNGQKDQDISFGKRIQLVFLKANTDAASIGSITTFTGDGLGISYMKTRADEERSYEAFVQIVDENTLRITNVSSRAMGFYYLALG